MSMFRSTSSSSSESATGQNENEKVVTRRSAIFRMLTFAAGLPAFAGLLGRRAHAAEPTAGPAIANIVTFTVPTAGMERFLAMCKTNSEASLKEPGITGFDVLVARDIPNTALLLESYRNEAAYKSHRLTPHFLAFVDGMKEIGATRTAVVATRYFPA